MLSGTVFRPRAYTTSAARMYVPNPRPSAMALRLVNRSCSLSRVHASHTRACVGSRSYAVVGTTTYIGQPPAPPSPPPFSSSNTVSSPSLPSALDERILTELRRRAPSVPGKSDAGTQVQLPQLVEQYLDRSGLVLDASLPYESRPGADRRLNFGGDDEAARRAIAMIVHAVQQGTEHKITYCSGFALSAPGSTDGQSVFVTCAHTLEEVSSIGCVTVPSLHLIEVCRFGIAPFCGRPRLLRPARGPLVPQGLSLCLGRPRSPHLVRSLLFYLPSTGRTCFSYPHPRLHRQCPLFLSHHTRRSPVQRFAPILSQTSSLCTVRTPRVGSPGLAGRGVSG